MQDNSRMNATGCPELTGESGFEPGLTPLTELFSNYTTPRAPHFGRARAGTARRE